MVSAAIITADTTADHLWVWATSANGVTLALSDERLPLAGWVVIAVGSDPNTRWLNGSGLVLTAWLAETARPRLHRAPEPA